MLGRRVPRLHKLLARANSTAPTTSKAAAAATPAVAPQAPNYVGTWSENQRARPAAGSGPRFEQTAMHLQPNPPSAMQLIAEEPIRMVSARKAVCDGGALHLHYDP